MGKRRFWDGDGAGAAILKARQGDAYPIITHSDGLKGEALTCDSPYATAVDFKSKADIPYMKMDGQAVFKFAVRKVPESIQESLEASGMDSKEINYFVLHQANKRIVEAVAKRLHIGNEKFPMNLQEYGNTSSASIPILLDEMNRKGQLKEGQKVVIAGFGAGLSWGASLLVW